MSAPSACRVHAALGGISEAVVTLTPRERIVRPGVCCDDLSAELTEGIHLAKQEKIMAWIVTVATVVSALAAFFAACKSCLGNMGE